MYDYHAVIERVVDGDTLDVRIDLGFDIWTCQRVRLYGVDTPETRTRDKREKHYGKVAQARVEALLPVGSAVRIRTTAPGKYGRYLADFQTPTCASLCDTLVQERLAVRYTGGARDALRAAHQENWDFLDAEQERDACTT